jgi:hypothetical protein
MRIGEDGKIADGAGDRNRQGCQTGGVVARRAFEKPSQID